MASKRSSTSFSTTTSKADRSSTYLDGDSAMPSRPATGRASTGKPKPRTKTVTSTGVTGEQQIICALSESRGISPTVGLAFVNLSTTEAVLCQIVDNQTYVKTLHKLHVFEPTEILIPNTSFTPTKSKLLQVLEANLVIDAAVTAIGRRYWDETQGVNYIHNLAFREDVEAIKVSIGGNFFATCCLAAFTDRFWALKYVETALAISFTFHSMRIKYEPSDGSMMMDLSTIRSLELIQNLQTAKSKHCLFGLLNHTLTPMGARMLRSNILQPLTGKQTVEKRYDALEELTTHEDMFMAVRQALKAFIDVDKMLTEIVIIPSKTSVQYWELSLNNVILVKQYVKSIPAVYDALEGCQSELLKGIRGFCASNVSQAVVQLIDDALNDDVTYQKKPLELRNQRTYAVKAGVNGLLDVARQTYKEANQDAYELLGSLADAHDINLSLKYDTARQLYFTFPASDLEDRTIPDDFVNVFRKKNLVECQTLSLVKLNQKIVDSHHEVLHMSNRVVQELIEGIRGEIAPLFKISESIAMLDMLASLAHVATTQDYCRPEISSTLAIKDGRHPLHEKFHSEKHVPNDVFADSNSRLQIIMGVNMAGKSTYIRTIALMTIMAQIGSFVPASYASFSIRSQLFARVSLDDSSVSGVSTFAAEMRETAFILRNIDAKSLVIIDELGRGTSTRDGLAIAIAVAEALVQSRAFVWFVTHFRDLAIVLSERPGVVNFHLAAELSETRMTMLYRVAEGPVENSHYGLKIAQATGLPSKVLEVAEYVSKKLEETKQMKRRNSKIIIQARRRKLVLGLKDQLVQAKEGKMDNETLRQWLKALQDEFVRRMSKLDDEERDAESEMLETDIEDTATTLEDTSNIAGHSQVAPKSYHNVSRETPAPGRALDDDQRTQSHETEISDNTSLVYSPSNIDVADDRRYMMSGAL